MLTKEQFDARLSKLVREQEELLARPNPASDFYNGIYTRYQNPVLTAGSRSHHLALRPILQR